MKRLLLLALCALFALNAEARTIYVDAKRPNNKGNGLSKSKAKKTIQAAINIAKKGDTILVYPGTYAPIETKNKKITIKSTKGTKKTSLVVSKAWSWSDLADLSKKVKKHNSQYGYDYTEYVGNATVLSGFLFNGKTAYFGVSGGTVNFCTFKSFKGQCLAYKSNLSDCAVTGNYIVTYGFLRDCKVSRTKITDNAWSGDSPSNIACDTMFLNCLIAKNRTCSEPFSDCTFLNCTVSENTVSPEYGGGGFCAKSKFYNCILRNNYSQKTWLEWKTVSKNGEHVERGFYDRNGTWVRDENEIDEGYEDENGNWVYYQYQSRTVNGPYTEEECITHTEPKKVHNVDPGNTYKNTDKTNRDPKLTSAYKLRKGSYCIDAGKLTSAQKKLVGTKDLAGKKRIKGKAIDRGCYEY